MQKIVFYGNCQLAVLSHILSTKTLNFDKRFEILKASDYDLDTIWREDAGTVFPANHNSYSPHKVKSIEKILDDSDIVVFQKIHESTNDARPVEITTDYIHDKYRGKKQMICIPSFWFSGYLTISYKNKSYFPYIFLWLLKHGLNNEQILKWLRNDYDPKLEKLVNYSVEASTRELQTRENEESSKYDCFISILDIISNYKNHLICYNHHHPSKYYFESLHKKLLDILDHTLYDPVIINDILLPGGDFLPKLTDFSWFRHIFPEISDCSEQYFRSAKLDIDFVNSQVDIVKSLEQSEILQIKPYLDILNS
jgi:hypothetical protein